MDRKCGEFSETKDATPEIQVLCVQVKSDVENSTKKKYTEFIAVKERTQVVNGLNYLIKVYVGGVEYIHLFVYEELPCNGGHVKLIGVQEDKTKESPLVPFIN